jgi:hypothetical protein
MKRKLLIVIGVVLVAIQFVPVDRENPSVTGEIPAEQSVRAIFERACYDCHSNETNWPWYSRMAPVSWLVAHDVEEGREHLNFSQWNNYSAQDRVELREEIWEEVEKGEMPLWIYRPLHPETSLDQKDLDLLKAWAWSQQAGEGRVMLLNEMASGTSAPSAVGMR